MMFQLGINYNVDEFPMVCLHGCPKDMPVEIIDKPHEGTNARDVKIGNLTVVIFEKEEE
jgi:hypothetical protein